MDVFIPFGVLTEYFTEQNETILPVLFRRLATFTGDNRKPLITCWAFEDARGKAFFDSTFIMYKGD
jgi:hypothetical protein